VTQSAPGEASASGRATLWLPLLRALTDDLAERVVFKDATGALEGVSDVDVYAAGSDSPLIERAFRAWATGNGMHSAIVCRHDWRGPTMVAFRPDDPHPYRLDVKVGRLCHGSFLFTIDDLDGLADVQDGYRRLRPGVDAAAKLLIHGTTRSGRRDTAGLGRKAVTAALAGDPTGALAAARFAGPAARPLRRGIEAALAGGWSRRDMAIVMAWFHLRSLARPDRLARQLHWRLVAEPSCPMSRPVDRVTTESAEAWRERVVSAHPADGAVDPLTRAA
jgi:hypothetical protein